MDPILTKPVPLLDQNFLWRKMKEIKPIKINTVYL